MNRTAGVQNPTVFARDIVSDGWLFAPIINAVYRFVLALFHVNVSSAAGRTDGQGSQGHGTVVLFILHFVDYLLSPYGGICFATSLVLNRIKVMSALRSTSQSGVMLPLWSRTLLHTVALVPLVYTLLQLLAQMDSIDWFPKVGANDPSFVSTRVLLVVAWSRIVETFYTTTTKLRVLQDTDFPLAGLSIELFVMGSEYHLGPGHYFEPLMAVLSRISIHLLELVQRRQWRFACNSLQNCYITYYLVRRDGEPSLANADFRMWPNYLVTEVGIGALITAYCAGEINWSDIVARVNGLGSFGEEEYFSIMCKIVDTLCDTRETPVEATAMEGREQLYRSYIVSGYLDQVENTPDDSQWSEKKREYHQEKGGRPSIVSAALAGRFGQLAVLSRRVLLAFRSNLLGRRTTSRRGTAGAAAKDFNILVTKRNYAKFLARIVSNGRCDNDTHHAVNSYLLPDFDTSPDYTPGPPYKVYPEEEEYEMLEQDPDEIKEELATLCTPELSDLSTPSNLSWIISLWSMLTCQGDSDKVMTRRQYAATHADDVLTEVVLQEAVFGGGRKIAHTHAQTPGDNVHSLGYTDEETDDEMEAMCPICQRYPRNVVLWPCRCLAVCNQCRETLGKRGFNACITCQKQVSGYSKINTV
ncbi:putative ubiquitin-protein ligase ASI3 KNAG_0A06080 [Huiozyma naganishii CBS 8797]|uniref:RING-type domain-containing protein n=1 Tax=Huiozyma naganishii (strain ATCC MYA-139 / BCRC 22969 / CBS 8797 / KCTC 17520 / NBRC 10181 / NCYC 3082 / Yp74L-3) TaxID=1071383 RepID=J7R0E2_HUIN7|nr:hypothetical protein KNAG_0A06080 [Kazachstania naganishii CBS 8797]CCK68270.1 hypothetical protein KNAG_0A06080 [Kazachstania naganishii CBS 8797]